MCSNNGDLDDLEDSHQSMTRSVAPQGIIVAGGVCKKCSQTANVLYQLSFREAECRACFLAYVRHKFRATLGSSKLLPRNAQVLLVFDGSAESIMLLDMMHNALTQNTYKRLHCAAQVLYIVDSKVEYNKIKASQKLLENYKIFKSYYTTLTDGAQLIALDELTEVLYVESTVASLNLQYLSSLTSCQDFIYEKRKRLILNAAKQLNCAYAFVADTSVTLAARLLTSITLGRGGSAALDVALLDERGKADIGVQLMRPIKDVNTHEVMLYLHAQELTDVCLSTATSAYGAELSSNDSLQNLTHTFIDNLQQNFTATVSTIYRTGDKIAANEHIDTKMNALQIEDENAKRKKCDLCLASLDYHNSNTLVAIEFSRLTSEIGKLLIEGKVLDHKAEENVLSNTDEQWSRLCHACRNIYRDTVDKNAIKFS